MPPAAVVRLRRWFGAIRRVRRAYRCQHGRSSHLLRPRRYTDKMQWRKLFDLNPVFAILCDKLATRDFVANRVGLEYLAPLLWHGDDPAQIPFDRLEPPFVLKSTHGSGHTIIIGNGQMVDRDAIRATAAAWLKHDHGALIDEPGYVHVPRRLVVERQIMTAEKTRPPEQRLFVFDGTVGVVNTVIVEDGQIRNGAFHTPGWDRLAWYFTRDMAHVAFPRPALLDAMIRVASRLSTGLDHVRVDIYDCGDRFWVGEMTVYPWSGLASFVPDDADYRLGEFWKLRNPMLRAVAGVLRGPRIIRPGDGSAAAVSPPHEYEPWNSVARETVQHNQAAAG
jgi:hypothetical protein